MHFFAVEAAPGTVLLLQTPRTSAPALQCASRARSSADAHRLLLFLPRRQPHMSKSHRDELAASAPILCLWALGAQVAALVAPCLQALLAARRAQRTRHPRQSFPRVSPCPPCCLFALLLPPCPRASLSSSPKDRTPILPSDSAPVSHAHARNAAWPSSIPASSPFAFSPSPKPFRTEGARPARKSKMHGNRQPRAK